MEKPTSIVIKETKQKLLQTINESNLPAFILEPILKDYYEQIIKISEQQYENDKKEYDEAQKCKKKESEK